MCKKVFAVIIGLMIFAFGTVMLHASEKIEITRNGEPKAVIVLGKNPTLAAAFAAQELRDHIELVTGGKLQIVSEDYPTSETRLLVGDSWAVAKLGVSAYRFKEQEYALKFFKNAIIFVGKDKNIPAPKDGALPLPDFYDEKGTMTAVYDFLYNYCGVRWYVPGEIGTCYNKKPTLVVKGTDVQRQPNMKYVWLYNTELWMPTGEDNVPRPEANLWKLRVGMGGQPYNVNHSFYGFYDRFLKDHPDWFAQGYGDQYASLPPQMCFTNPEFIAQVVQDARDYFDGKGLHQGAVAMGDVFGLVPMDNNMYCKCERCQAELDDKHKDDPNFSGGYASNYIWGFVNKVAKEVKKTHPDKLLGALSYWDYARYPSNIKLESNVAVMLCMDTREWFMPETGKAGMDIYNSWVSQEKDRPIYLWLYFCFPALNSRGQYSVFPGYYASTALKHSEMFSRDNIRGVFMEHSSEAKMSHLLDLPEVYLTTVMGRDDRINGKQAFDEFFKKFYGAAAVPMKKLYLAIEDTYYNPKNYPMKNIWFGGQTEEIAWGHLGTPERMAKFQKLMDQAKALAKTEHDKARVALFETGIWDHMKKGIEEHKEMEALRQIPAPTVSVKKQPAEIPGGDASKVDWENVPSMGGWRNLLGTDTSRQLESKMTHDGKYLYIQLEEILNPATLVSKGDIWFDDEWEVFFANKREKPYRQLAVNPGGDHVEYHWMEDSSEKWDSGVIYKSDTTLPDRWRVWISLPLDKLLPGGAKPGTPFYANIYRSVAGQSDYLAWSPSFVRNFHYLGRLGEITLE